LKHTARCAPFHSRNWTMGVDRYPCELMWNDIELTRFSSKGCRLELVPVPSGSLPMCKSSCVFECELISAQWKLLSLSPSLRLRVCTGNTRLAYHAILTRTVCGASFKRPTRRYTITGNDKRKRRGAKGCKAVT